MPPDSYLVEVLHYLNPHLIWIEVIDPSVARGDKFVFEQIGIYGVLPVELTLDVEEEDLKTRVSDEWLPAASVTIKKALAEAKEVKFCPTYIDRRSSIFDDNIHKYGELLVKKRDKKWKPLSKILIKAGIAIYDMCLFHQQLGLGKLNTRLKSSESEAVIQDIENYYLKKNVSKKNWKKSVEEQTVVSHATLELESALTTMNLQKHNDVMQQLLQNKLNDFELCKDIDEEPLGKGFKGKQQNVTRETKTKEALNSNLENNLKATTLKKKLELMTKKSNSQKMDNGFKNNPKQILENTKKFLELNATKNLERKLNQEISCKNNKDLVTETKSYYNGLTFIKGNQNITGLKLPKPIPKEYPANEKRVCYGPPGILPTKLSVKVLVENVEPPLDSSTCVDNQEKTVEKEDIFANIDSGLNVEITNKNSLMSIKQNVEINQKYTDPARFNRRESTSSKGNDNLNLTDRTDSEITVKSSSKVLQKKLMLYERKKTNFLDSSFTSCSETSNKDSSSLEDVKVRKKENKKEIRDSDDEEVIRKINEEYSIPNVCKELKCQNTNADNNISMKNSVNPFKNIDPTISIFVEKLVTPVLMVHTKMNKRIEPVFNLRDVNFNANIQMALKTMSIESPMMLQTISWFCILRGYSTFMISPVGSGKTMGYLPAVCRLVSDIDSDDTESVGPKSIIICATARSVGKVEKMSKMFLNVNNKVITCFAGVDDALITTSLLNGCDLLICTPSYLVRLLQITDFGVDLRRLATVVLDDCERLGEVYINELKYIMLRIKETLKNRANKELRVQYIVASRIWCDFMEPIVKKAPYSIVCIGAFQECVLYSKAGMSVSFVYDNTKMQAVHDFLTQIDVTKRIVIVCDTDDEIFLLKNALRKYKNPVFTCDSSMTIQDLYNLRITWDEYEEPLLGPILLCCNDTLAHMNVTDAYYLLIYSLPPLFSTFCRWFSVLNDKYPSIFKSDNDIVKIKILIEEKNVEQLPKMLNFIRRCTDNTFPQHLNVICKNIMVEKDKAKASKLVPLCNNLLGLGYCPDYWNCHFRHSFVEDVDNMKEWMPLTGQVTFKILHYHSAVCYSARLLSNTVKDSTKKYPQTYSTLSLKMGMYYSKESNKKPHGIPKIGDICAVSLKQNFFARCQVIKILSTYQRGNPNSVLIKLLDEEKIETTRDIYLYYIPEELKKIETHVVQVRLANIQPKDKDVTYSDLARDQLKRITDKDEELYMRGEVAMSIGNCVFVDTLEACQDLASINQTVVKHDFKSDLLEKHAVPNMEHLDKIKKLCDDKFEVKVKTQTRKSLESKKTKTIGSWAHLDKDNMSLVFFGCALSPSKFFVRLQKFESCLNMLLKEIQKFVAENPKPLSHVEEGDIVLAMFPDDETFERARIDSIIDNNKVKCFFVDQGDWREVSTKKMIAMKEEFISKLPFQAIECRLLGVTPAGEEWTDFATNWFSNICFDVDTDNMKSLYVKCFTKEKAEFTGGNKYGIVMIDTNSDDDIVINQVLIDVNLAKENKSEMKYLDKCETINVSKNSSKSDQLSDSEVEEVEDNESFPMCKTGNVKANNMSTLDTIFKQPIRSVPLVGSDDSDDSDRWHINMAEDFFKLFKPNTNDSKIKDVKNLSAIMNGTEKDVNNSDDKPENSLPKLSQIQNNTKELDSDDYTSPESSDVLNTPDKRVIKSLLVTDNMRKPKVIWRQNKKFVFIKVNLIGLQMYDVKIEGRAISFAANLNDVDYAFDIELYGAIDVVKSQHWNKGQYILMKLHKILNKNWLTLTKDGEIRKWIVYDVESIDVSSDEDIIEEHSKKAMLSAIQNIYNKQETESEDDDFDDDLNYGYTKK
ncbi:putative ATP-dependent RNA helicase TDRD12 [Papilio machaon]|uniref:putative ATP-dependent RNA helicase TDRD12 n=1 Tax=Papilio machaon TaxID=76193 RepID=UPI001E665914|nr:putative ATP-dependent RNA helicase TDRD12 [Papilio machaon]